MSFLIFISDGINQHIKLDGRRLIVGVRVGCRKLQKGPCQLFCKSVSMWARRWVGYMKKPMLMRYTIVEWHTLEQQKKGSWFWFNLLVHMQYVCGTHATKSQRHRTGLSLVAEAKFLPTRKQFSSLWPGLRRCMRDMRAGRERAWALLFKWHQ